MSGELFPGVWVDEGGGLHIDLAALLAGAGYADTPENRATMMATIRDQAAQMGAVVIEDDAP